MFDAKRLLDLLVEAGSKAGAGPGFGNAVNQVGGLVGQVLGQATSGMKEAAGRVDAVTGASAKAEEMLKQTTGGQGAGDLIARAKAMAGQNQMAAGAAIGGLAAVLLGTGAGRAIIGSAARLGGMALIGGLAYKALQNFQAGKPVFDLTNAAQGALPAPAAADQDHALRLVRAMIAAASADGVVDAKERTAILSNLGNAGLGVDAATFVQAELANPADISTLAAGVTSPEIAAQVYAAARLAIDPDTAGEKAFLGALAQALSIEPGLIAHIDAAASSAKG